MGICSVNVEMLEYTVKQNKSAVNASRSDAVPFLDVLTRCGTKQTT